MFVNVFLHAVGETHCDKKASQTPVQLVQAHLLFEIPTQAIGYSSFSYVPILGGDGHPQQGSVDPSPPPHPSIIDPM